MTDLEKKQLVVKSNRLVEASYRLTVQEQRIILLVASMIKPTDEDFETYRIDIKDFMALIGVAGHSKYDEIKEITKKLRERTIVIKDLEEDTELQIGWVSSFKYFRRKGYVQIRFDPELKPYFLQLKERFTSYDLRNVMPLRSNYSVRIYELLKQYEQLGQRDFTLKEIKKMLGLSESEYRLYGDFKRRVLKPAQKELAQKTDIYFDIQELKQGRKVKAFRFFIKVNQDKKAIPKIKMPKQLPPPWVKNTKLYYRLTDYFLLSPSQVVDILKKFPEERILSNLTYIENKYKQGGISNLGAYTIKAIEENYHIQTSLFDFETEQKELEQKRKIQIEKIGKKLEKEYEDKILSFQKTLKPKQLKVLENMAKEIISKNPEMERYKKIGGDRLFFRQALKKLIAEEAGLPDLDEWKRQEIKKRRIDLK